MPVPPTLDDARRRALAIAARTAILVEGWSDQAALETLAARRDQDLAADAIVVVPIGGATNAGHFATALGARGLGLRLAGLYDAPEERPLRNGLRRAGVDAGDGAGGLEALGFFACRADLEDELIRALGAPALERLLDAQGELEAFRVFQAQPAQRGRDLGAHLHRFLGFRSGRKIRYGGLLVEALPMDRVPAPLLRVLAHAGPAAPGEAAPD